MVTLAVLASRLEEIEVTTMMIEPGDRATQRNDAARRDIVAGIWIDPGGTVEGVGEQGN